MSSKLRLGSFFRRHSKGPTCSSPGPIFDTKAYSSFESLASLIRQPKDNSDSSKSSAQGNITDLATSREASQSVDASFFGPRAAGPVSTVTQLEWLLLTILAFINTDSMMEAMESLWNNEISDDYASMRMSGFAEWVRTDLNQYWKRGPGGA